MARAVNLTQFYQNVIIDVDEREILNNWKLVIGYGYNCIRLLYYVKYNILYETILNI